MVKRGWVPRPSEIIRIDFNPVRGHEQANLRPAVVLSHQGFNDRTGLAICIPCTTRVKGFVFEVPITGLAEPCVALAHHLRTLDWRQRAAVATGFATEAEMAEIRAKLGALLAL